MNDKARQRLEQSDLAARLAVDKEISGAFLLKGKTLHGLFCYLKMKFTNHKFTVRITAKCSKKASLYDFIECIRRDYNVSEIIFENDTTHVDFFIKDAVRFTKIEDFDRIVNQMHQYEKKFGLDYWNCGLTG